MTLRAFDDLSVDPRELPPRQARGLHYALHNSRFVQRLDPAAVAHLRKQLETMGLQHEGVEDELIQDL